MLSPKSRKYSETSGTDLCFYLGAVAQKCRGRNVELVRRTLVLNAASIETGRERNRYLSPPTRNVALLPGAVTKSGAMRADAHDPKKQEIERGRERHGAKKCADLSAPPAACDSRRPETWIADLYVPSGLKCRRLRLHP